MEFERYRTIPGWLSSEDAHALRFLAAEAAQPGGRLVEIGTWCGRSAWVLGYVAERIGATLVCVDPYLPSSGYSIPGVEHPELWAHAQFHALFGEVSHVQSLTVPSLTAATILPPGLDLVWIDGDHRYEAVRDDLSVWFPLLRPRGILCGHDFDAKTDPGVLQAVNEYLPTRELIGRVWWVRRGHDDRR